MRRMAIAGTAIGVGLLLARRVAPKLHARMLDACKGMFEQMPDDFPPKRMMGGIEEIRANTARTLELLEERKQAREAEPPGERSPATTHELEALHA
jgi:hypothetical protein